MPMGDVVGSFVLVLVVAAAASSSMTFGVLSYRKAGRIGVTRVDGGLTLIMGMVVWWTRRAGWMRWCG
jgi:hypothetical protein